MNSSMSSLIKTPMNISHKRIHITCKLADMSVTAVVSLRKKNKQEIEYKWIAQYSTYQTWCLVTKFLEKLPHTEMAKLELHQSDDF